MSPLRRSGAFSTTALGATIERRGAAGPGAGGGAAGGARPGSFPRRPPTALGLASRARAPLELPVSVEKALLRRGRDAKILAFEAPKSEPGEHPEGCRGQLALSHEPWTIIVIPSHY